MKLVSRYSTKPRSGILDIFLKGEMIMMTRAWNKIAAWLTVIGLVLFAIGAVIFTVNDGFVIPLTCALPFFVVSIALQVFGIVADYEALECVDREREYVSERA